MQLVIGHQKFSTQGLPYDDTRPFVKALIEPYTLDACHSASDRPFLMAAERLDAGPLLRLLETWLPSAADRRHLFWDTRCVVFGFPTEPPT